jgi:DNA-binding transcriptional LysR family regulator
MIKLESLRVFATVATHGNIKDAADHLCRTPSAVSMTLKQLEDDLGERLFLSDRKSSLTELGKFLLSKTQGQLNSFDKSIEAVRAFAKGRLGELTLAVVPSVAVHLLPQLLSSFTDEYPGVDIELFDIDSTSVAEMVRSGKADLGIAGAPADTEAFRFEPLFRDHFKVVCRKDDPLTKLGHAVSWPSLAGHNLIVNGASQVITSPHYVELAASSSMKVQNTSSLFAMTHAGLGVTILPSLATKSMPPGIVALELADPETSREVGILRASDDTATPAASRFLAYLEQVLPDQIARLGLKTT